MTIQLFITELRKNLGLTQKKMSEKLGVTQAYYSLCENGKVNLSRNLLVKLIYHFNISKAELNKITDLGFEPKDLIFSDKEFKKLKFDNSGGLTKGKSKIKTKPKTNKTIDPVTSVKKKDAENDSKTLTIKKGKNTLKDGKPNLKTSKNIIDALNITTPIVDCQDLDQGMTDELKALFSKVKNLSVTNIKPEKVESFKIIRTPLISLIESVESMLD